MSTWFAVVTTSLTVGVLFGLAADQRQYVLSIIMTAMVILYVVVETGWGGGSEDRR